MDEVVKKHLSIGKEARAVENRLSVDQQFPVLLPCVVRRLLQRFAHAGAAFVESTHELLGGVKRQWFVTPRGKIQLGSGQNAHSKPAKLGHMRRQFAKWHG